MRKFGPEVDEVLKYTKLSLQNLSRIKFEEYDEYVEEIYTRTRKENENL